MQLTAMRQKFRDQSAQLASELEDAVIDAYLNNAYQFTIPDQVPGQRTSGTWIFSTTAGVQEVAFPSYVYAVRRGAQIDGTDLSEHWRENEFWAEYDRTNTAQAQPYAILYEGRIATLYPTPDSAYTIYVPCRQYPTTGTGTSKTLASLTTDGLANHTHANAVVQQGLDEFADDYNYPHLKSRLAPSLTKAVMMLRGASLAEPRERRRRRTF